MKTTILLIATAVLAITRASAQEIDNTASYKNINSPSYIQVNLNNDVANHTDEQYTEGANLEVVAPWVKSFPLSKVLISPFGIKRYGLGIEQACYTPNLNHDDIVSQGRPFASTLFLKTFVITIDSVNQQRFSSTLSTGIIGPDALGKNIQDGFHQMIGDYVPPGWNDQIKNDVIVNYGVNYEKQLVSYRHMFSLDVEAAGRVGTFSDKLSPALNVMFGFFESPFSNERMPNKFKIYVYDHPQIDIVGYDATLEGGAFNKGSVYTIPAGDITRGVFSNRSGLVMAYKSVYPEYFHVFSTPQLSTGPEHSWDGLQVAVLLK
jgi:hypothetical protein